MKADNLAEPQDLVQQLRSNIIENPSFKLPIFHLVKHHAQVAVDDETKFYDQSVARANKYEQASSLLPLTRMSSDISHSSS